LKTNTPPLNRKIEYRYEEELIPYPYSLTGTIDKIHNRATATVSFKIKNREYSYLAKSTEILHERDRAKEVLITFNEGKITQPIITGIIQTNQNEPLLLFSESAILLECGDTRIELNEDGSLNLQALHINSQAYGPYRIKGASVKIN